MRFALLVSKILNFKKTKNKTILENKYKVERWKALSGLFYFISLKPFSSDPYVCQTLQTTASPACLINVSPTQPKKQAKKEKANRL